MSQGKIVITRAEQVNATPFSWGNVRWLFHGRLASDAEMTFGIVTLNPGEAMPAHAHDNCEELMYLIRGKLSYEVRGETHPIGPATLLRVPRGSEHLIENRGDEKAVLIAYYSAGVRQTHLERQEACPEPSAPAS